MRIARVEPLTTARSLRGPFDYLVPERLGAVRVGTVLEVPFGRRRAVGVVVGLASESEVEPDRLAEPHRILDEGPPPALVDLGLWVASAYCSTPARGLGLVIPPGTGPGGRRVRERVRRTASITDRGREAVAGNGLGDRQRAVLEALVAGPRALAEVGEQSWVGPAARRLARRGLVELRSERVRRRDATPAVGAPAGPAPDLTGEQRRAVGEIVASMPAGPEGEGSEPRAHLLHGVTGSGKTEVYLAAAREAIARGLGVIVLVPEIGLAPQTVSRFRERFGDLVALVHSRMPPGARLDEWERLRSGEARICVGPRSAVFAPVEALGLLVVDEEHDPSYKQESDPRYDARTVAERRSEVEGAALVCGTATPRPESWYRLGRLTLASRASGAPLPPVEVIDMRGRTGRAGPLHERTQEALVEVRERREKAIVMLNRRGWSAFLSCRACGTVAMCPNCDVSLVLHRGDGVVSCHHCGHREPTPGKCEACGSASIGRHGAGTERIERELERLLRPLPVMRLDTDTASAGAGSGALAAFDRADSAVLVGTQMVAKGHDFPDVTLAVVIDADSTLRFPDFRSEERTFALVAQLAGRSGRGPRGGRVLVQTLAPEADPIARAAGHDAAGFLAAELDRRRALSYPPFSTAIRIQTLASEQDAAAALAREVGRALGSRLPSSASVLGPAALFRRQGLHRFHLVVKARDRGPAVDAVRAAVERATGAGPRRDARIVVDVDPQ